jgi:hypothetical protein
LCCDEEELKGEDEGEQERKWRIEALIKKIEREAQAAAA